MLLHQPPISTIHHSILHIISQSITHYKALKLTLATSYNGLTPVQYSN